MIHDNEHDPEQDPEYFTPKERRDLARFITFCVAITAAWVAFLVWLVIQAVK